MALMDGLSRLRRQADRHTQVTDRVNNLGLGRVALLTQPDSLAQQEFDSDPGKL